MAQRRTPEGAGGDAPPVIAYVGLGGNLGDAKTTVLQAFDAIAAMPGVTLLAKSSLYGTAPVDASGDDYVNAVAKISTGLHATALLEALQSVERQAGRERPYRNAPRTLDLDLLLFGDAVVQTPSLQLPHPRMWERAFVLVPLAELAPALVAQTQLEAVRGQGIWRL